MNTTINMHGIASVKRALLLFNDFTATRLMIVTDDGSTVELNPFGEQAIQIEDEPVEDHRKAAA